MCTHLAWLGAPRTVASLVLEPEHGLLRQSYQPRRQSHGLMNADGWGVGVVLPDHPQPVRWRSSRPLWSDASFASVAPVLSSGCVVAAVRSATVGMPLEDVHALAAALWQGRKAIRYCDVCGNFSSAEKCAVCADENRHNGQICVVRDPRGAARSATSRASRSPAGNRRSVAPIPRATVQPS